jgi:hypothetical protein
MLDMVLKWAVIATYGSMTIIYGSHLVTKIKETVPWFQTQQDGSDKPTKP